MNIGIDAHMLGQHETGNETYIRELVRHLPALASADRIFVYVENADAVPAETRAYANVRIVPLSSSSAVKRLLWELPQRAAQDALDVLHISYNAPLRLPPSCALVVTVHDISFERHPDWFSKRLRWFLKASVRRSARAARQVITVSEWCRQDLIETYQLVPARVNVTYEAAGAEFRLLDKADALHAVHEKYKTGERFILALGNLQPRKNQVRLLQAFAQAKANGNLPHKLVIAGQPWWQADTIMDMARALGDAVVFTGYVPEVELPLMYNASELFCYPSLFEGFGLPVLEAMACGVPVITSNVTALPEVAGDAACLVNPYDVSELADALSRLANDAGMQQVLRARGLTRVQTFSWAHMAEQTLTVYQRAAAAGERVA